MLAAEECPHGVAAAVGILHDSFVQVLELAPQNIARERPAPFLGGNEGVLRSGGVFDDVAELRVLADAGREERPVVVQSQHGEIRLQHEAQRLQGLAVVRRRRERDRKGMPPDDQRHRQVGEAVPPFPAVQGHPPQFGPALTPGRPAHGVSPDFAGSNVKPRPFLASMIVHRCLPSQRHVVARACFAPRGQHGRHMNKGIRAPRKWLDFPRLMVVRCALLSQIRH